MKAGEGGSTISSQGYSVTSSSCVPSTSTLPETRSRPSVRQLPDGASSVSRLRLFVDDFDLLIDYLSGKPVDRHMHPVMLLTFDHEACKRGRVWRIAAALCYHVNHQV